VARRSTHDITDPRTQRRSELAGGARRSFHATQEKTAPTHERPDADSRDARKPSSAAVAWSSSSNATNPMACSASEPHCGLSKRSPCDAGLAARAVCAILTGARRFLPRRRAYGASRSPLHAGTEQVFR
jgi:hypothetical protein